jgi:chemotaxis protein CheX
MLARNCAATHEPPEIRADISARITFSGTLQAQCAVEFPASSARRMTTAFLGSDDDAMIGDAVGELCNMIAGGWKTRLGPPAWGADLSVPTVFREPARDPSDQPDHGKLFAHKVMVRRAYTFDDSSFVVSLSAL